MSTAEPKRQHVFCFVDGQLTVLGDGYVGKGDGWFSFDEDVVEWENHEEKSGIYCVAKIPESELIALRDFLNERFPANATAPPESTLTRSGFR